MPIQQARDMGAMALFGEKYGDTVRVIKFGPSMELCGGTHVKSTGQIGMIRILMETSVAAGVRRIEAISGAKVEEMMNVQQDMLRDLKSFFNNTPNLLQSIKKTIEENADLKKAVDTYMQEKVLQMRDSLIPTAQEKGGVKLITLKGEFAPDFVKSVGFQIRNVMTDKLAFVAATSIEGKPMLTVVLSDDVIAMGYNASQMIREAAKEIQGGGGGQPFYAQAGGKNLDGLEKAFEVLCGKF